MSSIAATRDVEPRRRQEKSSSLRDNAMTDLVQWRKAVAADQDDGRGRPRERPLWPEDKAEETVVGSPGAESTSSASSASTFQEQNDRTVPPSPYRNRQSSMHRTHSPPHSHDNELSPIFPSSSVFVRAPEHAIPPPATIHRERSRSRSLPPPSVFVEAEEPPAVFSALVPHPPSLSPWSTDDEDESAWETASVTTTTSASSPFPLSPSRTSPLPQPLVRQPSDEDDEHSHSGLLSPFRHAELEHEHRALQAEAHSQQLSEDWSLNLSQESLPHIPLRPFRNQVGGHSAIYKFTKRAVCKVSNRALAFVSVLTIVDFPCPPSSASCLSRKSVLRSSRARSAASSGFHTALSGCHVGQLPTGSAWCHLASRLVH